MTKKPAQPQTPDDAIPQDPGIPGPASKQKGDWPPEAGTATASNREGFVRDPKEGEDTSVSEAIGRTPRHAAVKKRKSRR